MPTLADTAAVVKNLDGTITIGQSVYRLDRYRTKTYGTVILTLPNTGRYFLLTPVPGYQGTYHLRPFDVADPVAPLGQPRRYRKADGSLGRSIHVMWVGDMVAEVDRRVRKEPKLRSKTS